MERKSSWPLIRLLIFRMTHSKQRAYRAMARESLLSAACGRGGAVTVPDGRPWRPRGRQALSARRKAGSPAADGRPLELADLRHSLRVTGLHGPLLTPSDRKTLNQQTRLHISSGVKASSGPRSPPPLYLAQVQSPSPRTVSVSDAPDRDTDIR